QGKISSDGCLKKEQMVVSAIASTPQGATLRLCFKQTINRHQYLHIFRVLYKSNSLIYIAYLTCIAEFSLLFRIKTIGNVSQSVWLLLTTLTPKNPPFIMVQV
ncbi:hypothetical protein ACI50N_22425, partial [Escherichia coli]|uniref:hypothetical protein n=1 Tax=Escherichia coli TaxID=562 RepID=UPI0038CC1E18